MSLNYNATIDAPVGGSKTEKYPEFSGRIPYVISEEVTIAGSSAQKALSIPFPPNFMPLRARLTATQVNALTTATSLAIGADTSSGASVLGDIAIGSLNAAGETVVKNCVATYNPPTTAFTAKLNTTNGSGTVAGTANGDVVIKVTIFGEIIAQHDLT